MSNVCALLYLTSNMRSSTSHPEHAFSNASCRAAEVGFFFSSGFMTLECLHFELVVSIWFAGCFCAVSSPPGCVWHQEDAWGKVLMKQHLISWEVHHVHSYSNSLHASPQSRSSKGRSSCTIWILIFPTGGANAYCILLFCFHDKDTEVGILDS